MSDHTLLGMSGHIDWLGTVGSKASAGILPCTRLSFMRRPTSLQDFGKLRNIRLSHLKGNPLNRKELADKIDITTCVPTAQRFPTHP